MEGQDLIHLINKHAPVGWDTSITLNEVIDSIAGKLPLKMIVLSCDICKSTTLMKEAIDFHAFANAMHAFFSGLHNTRKKTNVWIDKFLGDGMILYWVLRDNRGDAYLKEVIEYCEGIIDVYRRLAEPIFKANSMNFPANSGIRIGINIGDVHFALIAEDLTILGHPVVGAIRMTQVAGSYEIIGNIQIMHLIESAGNNGEKLDIRVENISRPTKEFPNGQSIINIHIGSPTE